jgi:molybdopterin-guanine dinucleotide biosynthesis protein A
VEATESLSAGAVVGAVLAGGGGSRIGGSKAMVELAGRPLASYPLSAIEGAGLAPLVVAKRATKLPALGVPVIREEAEAAHPLHGVVAALGRARGPVVVVACDMPLVTAELLTWLAGLSGTAVPVVCGRPQPMLARYALEARTALSLAVDEGRSAREAVMSVRPRVVSEEEISPFGDPRRLFFNVNDRRDLGCASELLGGAPLRSRRRSRRRPRFG